MAACGHFRVRRWAELIGREWALSCPPVGSFSCPPTLMPIEPNLHRIRKVGADLDERRPEIVVPNVEVIAGNPPLGHRVGNHTPELCPSVFGRGVDRRELLGHTNRGHTAEIDAGTTALRAVVAHRDDLVKTRAQTVNRLHVVLTNLVPAGAARDLTADHAAELVRGVRPRDAAAQILRA